MQKLKDNFLNLGIVIDNEYLDKYCSLVKDNLGLPKQVHKNTGKKRSIKTRQKMSAWQKGVPKSSAVVKKMQESQKIFMQNESDEHRKARVAKAIETKQKKSVEEKQAISAKISKAMKGRVLSEETKLKHSLALKGVEKSEEHKVQLARAKSIYRYYIDDKIFESTKEAIDYLENMFSYNLPYETWRRIINEQTNKYNIKVRRELKER